MQFLDHFCIKKPPKMRFSPLLKCLLIPQTIRSKTKVHGIEWGFGIIKARRNA